jgi:hypothetical protein
MRRRFYRRARWLRHAGGMPLTIATLNILNTADRWEERRQLIVGEFARLRPDLFAVQEVDFGADQDRVIANGAPEAYDVFRAPE